MTPDRLTAVAYALAEMEKVQSHGQLCPVWVRRNHQARIDECNCWVLPTARKRARRALEIVAETRLMVEIEVLGEVLSGIDVDEYPEITAWLTSRIEGLKHA